MPSLKKYFAFLIGWTALFLPLLVHAFFAERDMLGGLWLVFGAGVIANCWLADRVVRQVCCATWDKRGRRITAWWFLNTGFVPRPQDEPGRRLWNTYMKLNVLSAIAVVGVLQAMFVCVAVLAVR